MGKEMNCKGTARDSVIKQKNGGSNKAKTGLLVPIVLIAVVLVVVLIIQWPSLGSKALSFDDNAYLVENKLVQNPGWESAERFLTEVLRPSTVGGYYQPFSMISLMLDYKMGGRVDNLTPFHRTSLIFHLMNTALVIILLYLFFRNIWAAAAAGLIFGIHPMTVETIAWVGERKTTLAAFFALLSLIAYVFYCRQNQGKKLGNDTFFRNKYYWISLLMYVFSLLSKPTSTTLPLALLFMDIWPLERLNFKYIRRIIMEKVPFIAVCTISAVITYLSQKYTAGVLSPDKYPPMRIPYTLCHNIVFYLYKIIWPFNLTSHYPVPEFSISDPAILSGVAGTFLLLGLLLYSLRKTKAFLIGWMIFFIIILPTLQVIGFTNVLTSDKYAYLPSIGLLMILCWGVVRLWEKAVYSKNNIYFKAGLTVFLAGVIIFNSSLTRGYLFYWQDTEKLYQHMISLAPKHHILYYNLAAALKDKGRVEEAISKYREAIRLDPEFPGSYINLGNIIREKSPDEALKLYHKALEGTPRYPVDKPGIYYNVGITLFHKGDFDGAIENYKKAINLKPQYTEAYINLGNVYVKQGRYTEAEDILKKAVRENPEFAEAHENLGSALAYQKKYEEAIKSYKQAINLEPGHYKGYYDIGVILYVQNKFSDAASYFKNAAEINPGFVDAYNNLGASLQALGKIDDAIDNFRKAAAVNPGSVNAHKNLGLMLQKKGDYKGAVKEFQEVLRLNPGLTDVKNRLNEILQADKG